MDTVWVTRKATGTLTAWITEKCESPPERDMAEMLVRLGKDIQVDDPRFFMLVTAQASLKKTHGLPYRADFLVICPNVGMFVVEVDGLAYHGTQPAFQKDRKRDRDFAAAFLPVLRFTAKEIDCEYDRVYQELREFMLQ